MNRVTVVEPGHHAGSHSRAVLTTEKQRPRASVGKRRNCALTDCRESRSYGGGESQADWLLVRTLPGALAGPVVPGSGQEWGGQGPLLSRRQEADPANDSWRRHLSLLRAAPGVEGQPMALHTAHREQRASLGLSLKKPP